MIAIKKSAISGIGRLHSRTLRFSFIFVSLMICSTIHSQDTVDATTLMGKYMFGYQGWFWAPGDGSGNEWANHWFRNSDPTATDIVVDLYPDMRELGSDELFPINFHMSDSSKAMLYSAYIEKTVDRHFKWMRDYQVDGVWVQRFLGYALSSDYGPRFNKVLQNCRNAAEAYGRVFVVMYDLSGANNANIHSLKTDWMYLVDSLHITESPRYLRHKGKPLISLWGLAFSDRPEPAPDSLIALVKWLQTGAPAKYQTTVMGGTNDNWRTVGDPWTSTATCVDIISPWLVGRFADTNGANSWKTNVLDPDFAQATKLGKEYLPVVWPGFSWHNLYPTSPENQIRRLGGKFYWTQVYNAINAGATMLYNAMFDEVNEGTAMYKIAPKRSMAPVEGYWLTLDADGYNNLPSDWYLRMASYAKKMLNRKIPLSKTMPIDPAHPDSTWTAVADMGEKSPAAMSLDRFSVIDGSLFFSLSPGEHADVALCQVNGRGCKLWKHENVKGTGRLPLDDGHGVANGIYLLRAEIDKGNIVSRIVPVMR